jgi:magnesium transporter
MLKKLKYKDITWLDLESPTQEEVRQLGEDYGVHPIVLEELVKPSQRTKVDVYNGYVYLILHFPFPESEGKEVDFVLGKDFLITTHYEGINPLHDFARIFETDFTLKRGVEKLHAGYIFFYIMREFYAALEADLHSVNDQLKKVERKVFSGHEREVVEVLAALNRTILDFRWSLKSHREILESLKIVGPELYGEKFHFYFQSLANEEEKLWNMVENIRETFTDLRDTNDSLLAIKTNDIMRALTVAAFIFLPLTVIPQAFGMSLPVPFHDSPAGFVIIIGFMALASSCLYLLARYKKWF